MNSWGICVLFGPSTCIIGRLGFQSSIFATLIYKLTSLSLRIKIKLNQYIRVPAATLSLHHDIASTKLFVYPSRGIFSFASKKDFSVCYIPSLAVLSPIFFRRLHIFLSFLSFLLLFLFVNLFSYY